MKRLGLSRVEIAALALCVLGLLVAGYLTYVHYEGLEPFCLAGGGCETVQSSRYADFLGVPVSVLGLLGYVSIAFFLLLRGEIARMITALLALSGAGFSAYLTYLEIFEIKAICQWCVVSAVLMTALAFLTSLRFLRG